MSRLLHAQRRAMVHAHRWPRRTVTAASVLLAFMVVLFFAGPSYLPTFFQRLVGLVHAIVTMLVAILAVREFARGYNRVQVPALGRIYLSKLVGVIVFVLVLAWWWSSWAPIQPL